MSSSTANYMELGSGAQLNLNGNTQIVTDLFSDAASAWEPASVLLVTSRRVTGGSEIGPRR